MFYRATGVGRVYENLLHLLLSDQHVETVFTAVPRSQRESFLARYGELGVRPRFLPYGPMTTGDLLWKSVALRRIGSGISLYYFPGHNVPLLAPSRYIITVHDATAFKPLVRIPKFHKTAFRLLLHHTIRGAARIVTGSRVAHDEIVATFPAAKSKIQIVPNWIDDRFFAVGDNPSPPADSRVPVEPGYLLYLGLRIHHKNLDRLLAAFEILTTKLHDLRLVVAGRRYSTLDMVDDWQSRSPVADRLFVIEDPTDDEVATLMAGARVFVFPSLAEGFGLPPLEAMAAGVPVVCSHLPVFDELFGDAAHFVDAQRSDSIARGILDVLEDPALAARLRTSGRTRAESFRRHAIEPVFRELIRSAAEGLP